MDQFLNLSGFFRTLHAYPWWQVTIEMLLIGLVVFWVVRFLRGTAGAIAQGDRGRPDRALHYRPPAGDQLRAAADRVPLQQVSHRRIVRGGGGVPAGTAPAPMRLGETRLFRGWSSQIDEEIEALVESAVFCSRCRSGAGGRRAPGGPGRDRRERMRINADLSAPLLNTIFFPNTELHDLGVVVSQGGSRTPGCSSRWPRAGKLEARAGQPALRRGGVEPGNRCRGAGGLGRDRRHQHRRRGRLSASSPPTASAASWAS